MSAPVRRGMIIPAALRAREPHLAGHPVVHASLSTSPSAMQSGYGAASRAYWSHVGYKRTRCKGYDDAVKKYEKHKQKLIKAGCNVFAPFPKDKCKKHRNRMEAARKEGKAAWKTCRAYEKGENKGHKQIDTSGGYVGYEPPVGGGGGGGGGGGAGLVDPVTGLPLDPATGMPISSESDEGGGMGIWLAVGGLLLATGGILAYKKFKKD